MEYFKRLRNFWAPDWMAFVWLLFALPVLYFVQTTVHEGTHAVAAFLVTGNFPKVAPFPHSFGSVGPLNGVTIGDATTYVTEVERTDCNSPVRRSHTRLAGFSAAPQFLDIVLILIFSAITLFVPVTNAFLRFPLRAWYLGACIDFMYNTARGLIGSCNEVRDWSKFQLQADISTGVFALLTWLLWLVVLSHFVWVYWSRWGRDSVDRTGFWDYRWVAFLLGVLSLVGVLVSIFVNDPLIDKGSVVFIIPFVIQILALLWYWIYFGLTFRYKT